jgi:phage terminase large subunit-like protein
MYAFTSDFDRARVGYSPDRVDALVWALTELSGPQNIVQILLFPLI